MGTEAEQALATGQAEAERIASVTGMSPAAAAETGMPSVVGPGDTTDRVLAPAATAAPLAWDLGEAAALVGVVEEGAVAEEADGAGEGLVGKKSCERRYELNM